MILKFTCKHLDIFRTIIETLEHFSSGDNMDPEKDKIIGVPFPSWKQKNAWRAANVNTRS